MESDALRSSSSAAASTSNAATRAPACAAPIASARPSPRPAPVIRIDFPERSNVVATFPPPLPPVIYAGRTHDHQGTEMNRFEKQVYECMHPTEKLLDQTSNPLHRAILLNF